MKIVVKITRSDFDSALTSQGWTLEGEITLGETRFWHGARGLEDWHGRDDWWPEATSLYASAKKALEEFEAENLEQGWSYCFYTRAVLTWDGACRRWLLEASDPVRWRSGNGGYGTSVPI